MLPEFHPHLLHTVFLVCEGHFELSCCPLKRSLVLTCCGLTIIWGTFAEFLWKSLACAIEVLGVGQKWSSVLPKLNTCPHSLFPFRNPWTYFISDPSWSDKLQRHLLEHQYDPCEDTEKNPSCFQHVKTGSTDRQITLSLTLFVSQVSTRVICYIFHQM